jgi:Lhr-like helicase
MTIFHNMNDTCAITNTEQQQSSQQLLTFRHERGPNLLLLTQTYRSIFEETTEYMLEHFG